MAQILNREDAQQAAQKIVEDAKAKNEERKSTFGALLQSLQEQDTVEGGINEIAQLLALPEEHFAIIGPVFLAEIEKSYKNVNDELFMAQTLNAAGIKVENLAEDYITICKSIDEETGDILSEKKRSFLKQLLGLTYNAAAEVEGVTKRSILIPIEYCHEDAKMPAYAHLTDAGMDVFATEEITINPGETKLIPLGIKVALPIGYELQVRPKSGRSLKSKLRVANTPGTVDAGYRDEIGVIVDNIDPYIKHAEMDENGRLYNVEFGSSITIGKGEKIAQLVLSEVPKAVFYEVETVAGMGEDRQGGFGSTGDK
jgi:dUTP pyrophosphatase